jgi:hypothetical protein
MAYLYGLTIFGGIAIACLAIIDHTINSFFVKNFAITLGISVTWIALRNLVSHFSIHDQFRKKTETKNLES